MVQNVRIQKFNILRKRKDLCLLLLLLLLIIIVVVVVVVGGGGGGGGRLLDVVDVPLRQVLCGENLRVRRPSKFYYPDTFAHNKFCGIM